ncbi:MAG: nucleoside-diphosphate kinase [bacterium]
MERTLVIIKPDGVCKKHVGDILKHFEKEGFKILALKMLHLNRSTAEGFYSVHKGKPFFDAFISFIITAPSVIVVLEGKYAVSRIREIIGKTDSSQAREGTLRRTYGVDNRRNVVHGSESKAMAHVEISYFFEHEEIHSYESGDWDK